MKDKNQEFHTWFYSATCWEAFINNAPASHRIYERLLPPVGQRRNCNMLQTNTVLWLLKQQRAKRISLVESRAVGGEGLVLRPCFT